MSSHLNEEINLLADNIEKQVLQVKINNHQCNSLLSSISCIRKALQESVVDLSIPKILDSLMETESCLKDTLVLLEELSSPSWVNRAFMRNVDVETFRSLQSRLSDACQPLGIKYSHTQEDMLNDVANDIDLMEMELCLIVKDKSRKSISQSTFEKLKKERLIEKLQERRAQVLDLRNSPQVPSNIPKISSNEINVGELIGEGGFGQVFLAEWKSQKVAVKKLTMKSLTKQQLAEFFQECQIMHGLSHPNTLQLLGIVAENDMYMLIMEHMNGGSLYDLLQSTKHLTWAQRGAFAYDIASGMAYLHKNGIVHCDLKSLNILLNGSNSCKICDFGLSKVTNNTDSGISINKSEDGRGSLRWKAPELFQPNSIFCQETDVFAFGIVLWEISEREVPYGLNFSDNQIIDFLVNRKQRLKFAASCPKEIAVVGQKCWDVDPKNRPSFHYIVASLSIFKETNPNYESQNPILVLKQNLVLERPSVEIDEKILKLNHQDPPKSRAIPEPLDLGTDKTLAEKRIANVKAREFWLDKFGGNTTKVPWDDFYDWYFRFYVA